MVSKEFFEFISSHCGNVVAWLLVLLPFFHLTFIIGRFICYLFREYKIVSQVIGHDSDTPLWMVAFELSCMSSAQNYEDNKRYYRHLAETTESPMVKQLCLQEIAYLDEINIAMSTSREFAMILRHRADRLDDARRSIMQTLNLIREHQFHARIATKDSFKRLLAIYYVGDIYTEHVPDFDGMQYMEVNNATV